VNLYSLCTICTVCTTDTQQIESIAEISFCIGYVFILIVMTSENLHLTRYSSVVISVATQFMRGRIFNRPNFVIANCPQNVSV